MTTQLTLISIALVPNLVLLVVHTLQLLRHEREIRILQEEVEDYGDIL